MKPLLNRQEYNKVRSEFLSWAWLAKAQAAKLMTANL